MLKISDYITQRGLFGIQYFGKVTKVNSLDDGSCSYTAIGPEGEFECYGGQKLSQKDAKEWIKRFKISIKFFKKKK